MDYVALYCSYKSYKSIFQHLKNHSLTQPATRTPEDSELFVQCPHALWPLLFLSQNAILPAGFRQRDQTKKNPTGAFDRDALLDHLEKTALEHEDRDDLVPFTGEKKGPVHYTTEQHYWLHYSTLHRGGSYMSGFWAPTHSFRTTALNWKTIQCF